MRPKNEFISFSACTLRHFPMYKTTDYDYEQLSFVNFNTTCGMQLDQDNELKKRQRRINSPCPLIHEGVLLSSTFSFIMDI